MYGITTITTKGQIVIPEAIRKALNLTPSTRIHVELRGSDIIVRPVPSIDDMMGSIATTKHYTERELKEAVQVGLKKRFDRKYGNS